MLILFNKPFDVLCQFSAVPNRRTLKDFIELPDVYPAGRLDADSEGLLALTDDGLLQHEISDPAGKLPKTYWAQVEGIATAEAARQLASGVEFEGRRARPASVQLTAEPEWLWPRVPPIRHRVKVPTSWLRISITEGRNRQVRKMTAAVGFPTLRLVRFAIGPWTLAGLEPGQWRKVSLDTGEPDANSIGNAAAAAGNAKTLK